MKRLKIYLDTCTIGGLLDEEFQEETERLFAMFGDKIEPFVSELTIREIEKAPEKIKAVLRNHIKEFSVLPVSAESKELSNVYIDQGIVTEIHREDAEHIAIATVSGMDAVVSWNFRHIVNYFKIKRFNAVNLEQYYKTIDIISPKEIIDEDKNG